MLIKGVFVKKIEDLKKDIWGLYLDKESGDNETKELVSNLRNPSLLLNGNFAINQREAHGNVSVVGYFIADHWYLVNGTCAIKRFGCGLIGAKIKQAIEGFNYNNHSLTLSVKTDSRLYSATTFVSYVEGQSKSFPLIAEGDLTCELYYDGYFMWVIVSSGTASINISYVKLELGELATPYFHRPIQQELQDCQRYFIRVRPSVNYGSFATGSVAYIDGSGKKHCHCPIFLPVTMYRSPEVYANASYHFLSAGVFYTPESLQGMQGDNQISFLLDVILPSSANAVLGYSGLVRAANDSNCFIDFNAEIF